jgi:DNA-binding transcriptional ArsR family regulator
MSSLLPKEPPIEAPDREPQVVALKDSKSEAIFSGLSSDVARSILGALYDEPMTQSKLATELDTSIQNVNYHIDNLAEAGLVEIVDQWYSEKGVEMDVYAPNAGPLVLFAGCIDQRDVTQETLVEFEKRGSNSMCGD